MFLCAEDHSCSLIPCNFQLITSAGAVLATKGGVVGFLSCDWSMWTAPTVLLLNHLSYSTEILKIPATMAVGHNVEGDLSNTEVAAV